MDTHVWLDEVARQLRSSGTSLAYRRRLLDELRDHIHDLTCEERNHAMSAEAVTNEVLEKQLGTPQDIATAAEVNVARARFARRHPIVTYLLMPVPALLVLWVAYSLGMIGIFQLFESYKDQEWAIRLAGILSLGLAYVPAVVLTLVIAWVAQRSQTNIAWWLAASALVALVSALMMVNFRAPTAPGTGALQIGLGFPPDFTRWPQFAVPLVVTLAFVAYTAIRRRSDQMSTLM